jgi:hypothetical protein
VICPKEKFWEFFALTNSQIDYNMAQVPAQDVENCAMMVEAFEVRRQCLNFFMFVFHIWRFSVILCKVNLNITDFIYMQ